MNKLQVYTFLCDETRRLKKLKDGVIKEGYLSQEELQQTIEKIDTKLATIDYIYEQLIGD